MSNDATANLKKLGQLGPALVEISQLYNHVIHSFEAVFPLPNNAGGEIYGLMAHFEDIRMVRWA